MQNSEITTLQQFAKDKEVTLQTVHRWIKAGSLKCILFKPGGRGRARRGLTQQNISEFEDMQNKIIVVENGE